MYYAFAFFKSFINYFMALSLGGDRNTIVNEFSTLKNNEILICGKSQIFISLCLFVLSSIENIDETYLPIFNKARHLCLAQATTYYLLSANCNLYFKKHP